MSPPGMAGKLCDWINSTAIRRQPFITVATVLPWLGALVGRKVAWRNLRTNIYCMAVAESSFGKAHPQNCLTKLAHECGCSHIIGPCDMASDSALEKELAASPSLVLFWDEVGYLLKGTKNTNNPYLNKLIPLLMQLYSKADTIVKGKARATSDSRTLVQPCCSISGTSSMQRFIEGLTKEEVEDGWISRCIVFITSGMPRKNREILNREAGGLDKIPAEVKSFVQIAGADYSGVAIAFGRTGETTAVEPSPTQATASDGALKIFEELDLYAEEKCFKEKAYLSLWNRAEENARRIALILAACESLASPYITDEIARYSCSLVRYCIQDFIATIAPYVTAEHESDYIIKQRKAVADAIKQSGDAGCAISTIYKRTLSLPGRYRTQYLRELIEAGEVREYIDKSTNKRRFKYVGS